MVSESEIGGKVMKEVMEKITEEMGEVKEMKKALQHKILIMC